MHVAPTRRLKLAAGGGRGLKLRLHAPVARSLPATQPRTATTAQTAASGGGWVE